MYLAYAPLRIGNEIVNELSLVPDRVDGMTLPIPIKSLPRGGNAVLRVGHGDCCTVSYHELEKSYNIKIVTPACLYLTPDLPEKPGFQVGSLKIKVLDNGFEVFYSDPNAIKEEVFKQWEPTKVRL